MNAIEKQLYEDVKEHPEDWSLRFDLVDRLAARGEAGLASKVIGEAPEPPGTEEETLRAIHLCSGEDLNVALAMGRAFLANQPESAEIHLAIARLLCNRGEAEKAAEHYGQAVSLDGELRDAELEQWFENSGIRLDIATEEGVTVATGVVTPEGVHVIEEGREDDEVRPIEVGEIASLKNRREAEAAPPPALVVTPQDAIEAAPVVDHYAIEELHPAETQAVAPPPDVQVVEDEAGAIEQMAMEQTGLVTARAFSTEDIKQLQEQHQRGKKEKVSALGVAILVHAVVFLVLGLVVIAVPRQNPPEIVALASPSDEVVPEIEKKEVQKVAKPNPASATRVNVLTVANTSSVAVPVIVEPIETLEPIGAGSDFGMAMNFGAPDAGNVSFFGSATKANRVVFVVDSSGSMNAKGKTGMTKFKLMKEELKKTVKGLSSGVEFQIIFFSGPCWFVGDKVPDSKDKRDDWVELVKNGKTLNFWHYKDGEEDQLIVGKYRQATPGTIRRTMREIEETRATFGTDWRVPLQMGMVMEPDVIYFMTDGAVGKHPTKPPVVEEALKFNRRKSKAKINTICLMVPQATGMLKELAEKTRGEFTLVLEDGTPLRGKELEEYEKAKKKKK